jgi:predicted ATPase
MLAGQGRVVFVTGEAGSGKTALLQEFVRRAQDAHPDLVVATGNCSAHTGIGDPYLSLREILALLTGDVEASWAAGAITSEYASRLWSTLPYAAEALVEAGPDLIDTFVSGPALLERAETFASWSGGADWFGALVELVESKAQHLVYEKTIGALGATLQQNDLFDQYTSLIQRVARRAPLVLVVDDLQWADAGAINLLFHMGRQLEGTRILVVGAYRPEEVALGRPEPSQRSASQPSISSQLTGIRERHPLEPVVNELRRVHGTDPVNVDQANRRDFVAAILDSEKQGLGTRFRDNLLRRTQGHPLFTVELLRGMQERGDLVFDAERGWIEGPALDWDTLPARVEAAIAERIGRLSQPLQAVLRVASVEGEDFIAEVVAHVLGMDERELVGRLSSELDRTHRLVRAQAIERLGSQRLSRYRFRHFLCQMYLYDSLDAVERAYLHEDVGSALERLYGGYVNQTASIAPKLARHFQEAGITEKAIRYLYVAGERAVQLSAYPEAIAHLSRGLEMLVGLPDADETGELCQGDVSLQRARQELAIQIALGTGWHGLKGVAAEEFHSAYARSRELCERLGETSQLSRVLGELALSHYVLAEHRRAHQLGVEALDIAQRVQDPLLVALGHWYVGIVLFALGEYAAALAHLEEVVTFYRPEQHHRTLVFLRGSDSGLSAMAYVALCLWCLGYPERALESADRALALAWELGHPFTLADVLAYAGCLLSAMRRDAHALAAYADDLIQLSTEKVLPWLDTAICNRGEAVSMLGQVQEGRAQLREGMPSKAGWGVRCYLSGTLRALAVGYAQEGQPGKCLSTLAEALALVEETDERLWEAELVRLKGDVLLVQSGEADAEASYREAIDVARRQQAKSWQLRATTSLAHLLCKQGRTGEARQRLTEIYGWFQEGFETPDLQEARALLDTLVPR